jgi:hypothetical protein
MGRFLSGLRDVDVICDVGRLAPDSPVLDFVAQASAVLMVARPTAEQLQPAARRMMMLRTNVSNLGWVLIGQKPYGPADVESTYKFPVVGVIADDARSVTSLENGVVTKRIRRHPFIRSSATLAQTLSEWLAPLARPAEELAEPASAEQSSVSHTQAPTVEPAPVAGTPPMPAGPTSPSDSTGETEPQSAAEPAGVDVEPALVDVEPRAFPPPPVVVDAEPAPVDLGPGAPPPPVAPAPGGRPSLAKPPEAFRAAFRNHEVDQDRPSGDGADIESPRPASPPSEVSPDWVPPEPPSAPSAGADGPAANAAGDTDASAEAEKAADSAEVVDAAAHQLSDGLSVDDLEGWDGDQFVVTTDLSEIFTHPRQGTATDAELLDAPAASVPKGMVVAPESIERATESPRPVPPMPPTSTQIPPASVEAPSSPPSPFPHEDADADWMAR